MKKVKLFESFISEANRGKVHKAAKQGSYPAVIVVVLDGKVIHQEPVSTPEVAPATFNVMQEKYPKALLHLEDKTGKRLFSESIVSESSKGEKIKVYQKYNKKPTIAYIQGPVPNGKSNQYIATDKQGNSIEVHFGLGLGTGQKDPVYMYHDILSKAPIKPASKGEKIKVYQKYNKKPTIAYIQGPVPNGKSNQYIAIDKQGNSIEVEFGLGLGTGQKDPVYMYAGKYNANESVVNEASKDIEKEIKDLEDYQAKLSKKLSTEKKPSIRKNLSKLKDDIVTKKLKLEVKLDKLAKKESKSITEKREDVGKYNTVKKVISKLGRRPSEKDLAKFINDNYYDVTEVERGDDDSKADDKIADLVGVYKFDIDDWETAWNGVQNESVVSEGKMPDKLTNDDDIVFLKTSENSKGAHYNVYYKGYDIDFGGVGFGTEKQLKSYAKEYILSRQWANKLRWEDAKPLPESVVTEAKNTIGLAFKEEQDYLDFKEFVAEQPRGAIRKNIGFDSKTKSWNVEMDVKVLDSIYGEGTPSDKKSGWYGGLPDDFESVIIESVVTEEVVDTCWDGYKLGNPKTKISSKTGKRVNNCVPTNESVVNEAAYENSTQNELAQYIINLSNELKYAKANNDKKEIKFLEGDIAEVKAALAKMKNESVVTESKYQGMIAGDVAEDIAKELSYNVKQIVKQPNDSVTYFQVKDKSSVNKTIQSLIDLYGIEAQSGGKQFSPSITVKFDNDQMVSESVVTEGIFDSIADPIKALHFETDPKTAELMKMELGKKQGETNKKKQIDSAEYSLRRFRKSIKFGDGTYLGVFLPGSYDASVSTLGDGPHKKAVAKVKWNQKKYDQWLEDMSANGGADNAFDMAQNAKNETGLIDWVKKNFKGDDPLQRIQWDIEAFAESVTNEEIKSYNEKDTLYKQIHDKYAESIKGLKAGKIKKLTDLVSVQRWAMEDEHDTPGHDHKKMSATFKEERKLFKQWMAGDKDVQLKEAVELVESFKKFKDHIASINDDAGSTADIYFTKGKGYYAVVEGESDYDFDAKDKQELIEKLKDNKFTNEPFEGSI